VKRALDLAVSLVSLALLSPAFLAIAAIVRLDSEGPAFYRGVRMGRHGMPFQMWKFRTMRVDSESQGITTGKDDPRITRVGKVLRKYKIDELPQLINVLTGEMSLVGPRPEFQEHTSAYHDEEKLILTVRPGITDYASLQFYDLAELVGSEDPHQVFVERLRDEKNRLRVAYVKQQSLREDFRILLRTVFRVVRTH
jgi:lipopolysaccharide/colanic/teichoic acid biosynthesis glycosyltransferase